MKLAENAATPNAVFEYEFSSHKVKNYTVLKI
jgi:hypothetical protein